MYVTAVTPSPDPTARPARGKTGAIAVPRLKNRFSDEIQAPGRRWPLCQRSRSQEKTKNSTAAIIIASPITVIRYSPSRKI